MGFFDFFRAPHKHSNPEVRAEAVRNFDADDLQKAIDVAKNDANVEVRKIAIGKIDSPDDLLELAAGEKDEGLADFARTRRTDLLTAAILGAKDPAEAEAALAQVDDTKLLAHIARHTNDETVARQSVERLVAMRASADQLIDVARRSASKASRKRALQALHATEISGTLSAADGEALFADIAINDSDRDVALTALIRVESVEKLREVATNAKLKAVRTQALESLPKEAAPPKGPSLSSQDIKSRKARMLQLCLAAEQAAKRDDFEAATAVLDQLREQWADIGSAPGDEPVRERFDKTIAEFEQKKAEIAREAARAENAIRAKRDAEQQAKRDAEQQAQLQREREAAEAAERVAKEASLSDEERAARARAEEKRKADEARKLEERLTALCEQLERANENPKARRAKLADLAERWKKLDGGELPDLAKPSEPGALAGLRLRFASARDQILTALAKEEEQKAAAKAEARGELEKVLKGLEPLKTSEKLPQLDKAIKAAQTAIKKFSAEGDEDNALVERVKAALEPLVTRASEVRDSERWKRWANLPKLEQLCAEAEALAEVVPTIEDKRNVPKLLKELHANWKAAGSVPKEKGQALWERFKKATDLVHELCKEYFSKLDGERDENLKKKEALCEKAEALIESSDWKETSEAVKRLQAEWKEIGPVAGDPGEAVWKRFRAACDKFFERRDQHDKARDEERLQNLVKKIALAERAEALATSQLWKETAEKIKALQEEWKEIGHVPRDQADAVWDRFRKACDLFFDARKAAFAEKDGERNENLKKKEELCVKAEALAASEDRDAARTECKALQAAWKKVGHVPRDQADAIWDRFRKACDAVFQEGSKIGEADPADMNLDVSGFVNRLPLQGITQKLAAVESAFAAFNATALKADPTPEVAPQTATSKESAAPQSLASAAESTPMSTSEQKNQIDDGWDD